MTVGYTVPFARARFAVAQLEAAATRLEDEAADAMIGAPGNPGNPRHATYLDRWRSAVIAGLDGPFDPRLGPLTPRGPA